MEHMPRCMPAPLSSNHLLCPQSSLSLFPHSQNRDFCMRATTEMLMVDDDCPYEAVLNHLLATNPTASTPLALACTTLRGGGVGVGDRTRDTHSGNIVHEQRKHVDHKDDCDGGGVEDHLHATTKASQFATSRFAHLWRRHL
jgi:hypothetical protein